MYSRDVVSLIVEMYQHGIGPTKIARTLDLTTSQVSGILRRAGVPSKRGVHYRRAALDT